MLLFIALLHHSCPGTGFTRAVSSLNAAPRPDIAKAGWLTARRQISRHSTTVQNK